MLKKILTVLGIIGIFSQTVISIPFASAVDPALAVSSFTISDSNFDPTEDNVQFAFTLSKTANVTLYLMRDSRVLDIYGQGSKSTGTYDFDAQVDDHYIGAGDYTMKLEAKVTSPTVETVTATKAFEIDYNDSDAPELDDVDLSDDSFDAIDESTTLTFTLDGDAEVKINVLDENDNVVFEPEDFDWDDYDNEDLEFEWDGTDDDGDPVDEGDYRIEIMAENSDGAAYELTEEIAVDSEGSDYLDGSSKISDISFDPSATSSTPWDPTEEELNIEWDLNDDFDEFTVDVRKSGNIVEIYDEEDLDADDNYEVDFDGIDDDDEYLDEGTWRVRFTGEIDNDIYVVERNIYVEYDEPSIKDTFVTKSKIDPEEDEGTYFVFKLDGDSVVDVDVLEGSSEKVSLLEDKEVEADKWYAVYWDGKDDDGDDFDYDDTFKIRLTAKNTGNNDVAATMSEEVDLAEDTAASSKANVINDMAIPPIVEEGDDILIEFLLKALAKVKVEIYEGTSTSGSADETALSSTQKTAGIVKVYWEADDDGLYTYKITSIKVGSTGSEEEVGRFVVGDLGEIFDGGSDNVHPDDDNGTYCGRFTDVSSTYKYCEAIKWVTNNGMFSGYPNGTFKPYNPISRVEVLAVVLRAVGTQTYEYDGVVLPWRDVDRLGWYMPYLRTGKALGIINGYRDGTVQPGNSVSRSEFLKVLYQADFATVEQCTIIPYRDVTPGVWYTNYICQSEKDQLFDISSLNFMPGAPMTRGEVANALYKFFSD